MPHHPAHRSACSWPSKSMDADLLDADFPWLSGSVCERPSACASLMPMNWDDCSIEEKRLQVNIVGDTFRQRFATLFFALTGVPLIHTVAKGKKQVGPRRSRPCNPPHSFKKQSVSPTVWPESAFWPAEDP